MDQIVTLQLLSEHKDRTSMVKQHKSSKTGREGFTLTELLIVIVIIAILAAIIYPVFSSVKESNRQATSISNLHDISTKLAEFELDKHEAPPVLFVTTYYPLTSYTNLTQRSTTPVSMDDALEAAQEDAGNVGAQTTPTMSAAQYMNNTFPGLYPTYISDVTEFTDPNNTASASDPTAVSPTSAPGIVYANVLGSAGTLSPVSVQVYTADAYDASPQISGANSLNADQLVARYQPAWTKVSTSGDVPTTTGWTIYPPVPEDSLQSIYERQLHWQFPPADTYVTSTTYHVPKSNVVLVLYNDGSVKKLTSEQFTNRDDGADPASIAVNANGVATGNFWQVLPSGK